MAPPRAEREDAGSVAARGVGPANRERHHSGSIDERPALHNSQQRGACLPVFIGIGLAEVPGLKERQPAPVVRPLRRCLRLVKQRFKA